MPSALRSRLALLGLLGAFMIPVGVSGLRGLTHVLTCREAAETPFTMTIHKDGPPEVTSSQRLERGVEAGGCRGLSLDLRARGEGRKVAMTVLITNNTSSLWRGTVQLAFVGETKLTFPVEIGSIPAGKTGADTVELELGEGTTEAEGALLIGP